MSVIVPVYNTGHHLRKTLDSCVGQIFSAAEYILVDDGSTDGSGDICDEYARQFDRIRVFHRENAGVSAARNYGISVASRRYMMFVDADDYLEPNAIAKLHEMATSSSSDLAVCGYFMERVGKNGERLRRYRHASSRDETFAGREALAANYPRLWESSLLYNVWNKLFRTEIVRGRQLRFRNMKLGEDLAFVCDYLSVSDRIAVTSDCLYHYVRDREGAATARYIPDWYDVRAEESARLHEFFKAVGIDEEWGRCFLAKRFLERVIGCIENEFSAENLKTAREKRETIAKIINSADVLEAVKSASSMSLLMALMTMPIRLKSVQLAFMMGTLTSLVRFRLPSLFLFLKVAR